MRTSRDGHFLMLVILTLGIMLNGCTMPSSDGNPPSGPQNVSPTAPSPTPASTSPTISARPTESATPQPARTPTVQPAPAPAFTGTRGPVQKPGTATPPVLSLTDVQVGRHDGFDRIVFTFQ